MKNIVNFSGGKDSTAMLLLMLEKNIKVDEVIFADTGIEFDEVYNHIKKVEKYINQKIIILKSKKSFDYYFAEHILTKGKNKGKRGYGWADLFSRWCTSKLKTDVINRYLKKYDKTNNFIGIAYDEEKRYEKNKNKNNVYPLIDWGLTQKDCLDYCQSKGFDWEGLYDKFSRSSCYLCPLQDLKSLKCLYNNYPDKWLYMKYLDSISIKNRSRKFRLDYSIKELEQKFKSLQLNLFNEAIIN